MDATTLRIGDASGCPPGHGQASVGHHGAPEDGGEGNGHRRSRVAALPHLFSQRSKVLALGLAPRRVVLAPRLRRFRTARRLVPPCPRLTREWIQGLRLRSSHMVRRSPTS